MSPSYKPMLAAFAAGPLRREARRDVADNLTDELNPVQGNASFGTLGYAEIIYARPRTWFVAVDYDY